MRTARLGAGLNFTNEGGYEYRFRYLKNIMGLWMIQSVKKELQDAYWFAELCTLAEKSGISTIVDFVMHFRISCA